MNDIGKKTWKGFVKKGLVFCMVGVMTLGMAACGGKDKKSNTKPPKTRTEQSTEKKTTTKKKGTVQKSNKNSPNTKEKKNN